MHLDPETLLVARVMPIMIVTAVFATTSALRHNDEANRTWTAAFAAVLSVSVLDAIHGADATAPTIVVAATDASTIFALGALWSGCRLIDGRPRSFLGPVTAAAAALAAVELVQGADPDPDLGSALRLGVSGAFAWLAAAELLRGRMRHNLNSRILQIVLFTFGGGYIAAAALSTAALVDDGVHRPSVQVTAIPLTALFVVAAICLAALRVERAGRWWSMDAEARRRTTLDVLATDAFTEDAVDRIERATLAGRHVGLVLAQVNDLEELNTAFGRESGDRALAHVAGILRTRAPADALLGHLGAGRFVVLVVAETPAVPSTIVDAIRTGLTDSSVGEGMELRTDAAFGTAHTRDTPADLDTLMARARVALAQATAQETARETAEN